MKLEKGYVKVDGAMATDEPGIFAIGDVVTRGRAAASPARPRRVARGDRGGGAPAGKNTEPLTTTRSRRHLLQPEVAGVG